MKKFLKIIRSVVDTLLWLLLAPTLPFLLIGRLLRLPKRPLLALDLMFMKFMITREAKRNGRGFEEELGALGPIKKAYLMMKKESGF